ncbi:MAG: hypothetical protein LBR00_03265 [Clostridiales Family XIII bacterium]|jgi:hypothetical protein|nr:hypothetical protein [Clostridiales Family XIII bacterium]
MDEIILKDLISNLEAEELNVAAYVASFHKAVSDGRFIPPETAAEFQRATEAMNRAREELLSWIGAEDHKDFTVGDVVAQVRERSTAPR